MWSRNPTPVLICEVPLPSSVSSTWTLVSRVVRSAAALRPLVLIAFLPLA